MSRPRTGLGERAAPHLAILSVGYVMFGYAGVTQSFLQTYSIDFASFGLVMSATLLPFVLVQWPAGWLVKRASTTQVLLAATVGHAGVALMLDFAPNFTTLLALRFLWGIAGGTLLSVGATHIARLWEGQSASRQQGIFGGMLTLGGAVGFAAAPWFVATAGRIGVQAGGAVLSLPAVALLWVHRQCDSTAPTGTSGNSSLMSVATNPTVILASVCYVAIISSYMTLSTFITAYFDEIGVFAPLNVFVLGTATLGRGVGAGVLAELSVSDSRVIGATTALALVGFVLLAGDSSGPLLVILPFLVMLAVSVPFGAVYNVAANATASEGVALATVVAVGNVGALAMPTITGVLRDSTGDFEGAFLLLGSLNAIAIAAAVLLAKGQPGASR